MSFSGRFLVTNGAPGCAWKKVQGEGTCLSLDKVLSVCRPGRMCSVNCEKAHEMKYKPLYAGLKARGVQEEVLSEQTSGKQSAISDH